MRMRVRDRSRDGLPTPTLTIPRGAPGLEQTGPYMELGERLSLTRNQMHYSRLLPRWLSVRDRFK